MTDTTLAQRFWAKVNKNGPVHPVLKTRCWVWTGSLNNMGYGMLNIEHKPKLAHRVSWLLRTGEWPMQRTLHKCDNPPCVRFGHLFQGTQKENLQDAALKGRTKMPTFEQRAKGSQLSKLTEDEVKQIRDLYALGNVTHTSLAKRFNVTPAGIGRIIRRETWKHLV